MNTDCLPFTEDFLHSLLKVDKQQRLSSEAMSVLHDARVIEDKCSRMLMAPRQDAEIEPDSMMCDDEAAYASDRDEGDLHQKLGINMSTRMQAHTQDGAKLTGFQMQAKIKADTVSPMHIDLTVQDTGTIEVVSRLAWLAEKKEPGGAIVHPQFHGRACSVSTVSNNAGRSVGEGSVPRR